MKSKRPFRLWKLLGITLLISSVLLALFFVALVWNPFEGRLRDVRDVVPREVDFYLRKTDLAEDFAGGLHLQQGHLPRPAFWDSLTGASGWRDLAQGPTAQAIRADLPQVQQAVDAMASLQESSGGFVDVARDLVGTEIVIAGYTEDRSRTPAQPLQQPRWCVYARVGWRLLVAHGLLNWSMVQNSARGQGVEIVPDGELLMLRSPQLQEPLYLGRRLDCMMLANHKDLLVQSLRLADGAQDEQPFGLAAQYGEGVTEPVSRWVDDNNATDPNVLEFSVVTQALDGFRRFAATWPDAANRDSMNERVLASFLNLRGWNSLSGALLFEPGALSVLGRIVLNSNLHTPFQSSFYRAETQTRRRDWLTPFLGMVPDSACAAAALRVPPGEFLHAMYDAMLQSEREMLDDSLRRCRFQGQQLADTRDLIERLRIALLPRMGFVFRKNVPDMSRNENGELYIPVIARSPVPQVAWVFWLRQDVPGSPADDMVDMLRTHAQSAFRISNVYHLPVDGLPEQVTEFANAQIPGTGEIAAIVFRDFLVLSNSGPLIKDILRTRYSFGGMRSITEDPQFRRIEKELPQSLNGFVWLRGKKLLAVLDDYREASQAQNREPDPVWEAEQRSTAEDVVRRMHYPQYPSLASMPQNLLDGEFNDKVRAYLREQWGKAAAGFSSQDLPMIDQLRGVAKLVDTAYLQVQLENNYIRLQGKVIADY
ncbi:MAG: hypothetical protein AB7O97_06605 [Planctomycetota bacterium]